MDLISNYSQYCSAITGSQLRDAFTYVCYNNSKTKKFVANPASKTRLINELMAKNVDPHDVKWVGQTKTELLNGSFVTVGYDSLS